MPAVCLDTSASRITRAPGEDHRGFWMFWRGGENKTAKFESRRGPTIVMQPGPAVSTRARAALGDISNRGLAGGLAAKAGGKVRRPPVPNHPAPGN